MLRSAASVLVSRARKGTNTGSDSPTVQSARNEADINVLVRRFGVTGLIAQVERPPPLTEFADVFDFQSSMNLIRRAQESFAGMSAITRKRFNNDPADFVNFCDERDDKGELVNLEEMRKMGLAVPKKVPPPVPPPMKVEIVNPVPVPVK